MQPTRILCAVALLAGLIGCFQPVGLIYTEVTTPLDLNFDRTPVFDEDRENDVKCIRWWGDIVWDTNAIADVAKKQGGIDEVYYADLRTVSVFLGLWQQQFITIYGKPAPPPPKRK